MRTILPASLAALVLAALLALGPPSYAGDSLKTTLEAAAGGGDVPAELVIVYDDMHGLHGGSTIELRGDGAAARRDVAKGQEATATASVPPEDVAALLKLLVELKAWEQQTPERQLVPGESQARLALKLGEEEAGFWEFYNDMEANQRLARIKERLDALLPGGTP